MHLLGNLSSLTHPMLAVPYLILQTISKTLKALFLRKSFTLLNEASIGLFKSLKLQFARNLIVTNNDLIVTNVGAKPQILITSFSIMNLET